MNVFISWSGDRSKILAGYLYEWLSAVVQKAKPWMSQRDIDPGQRWNDQISTKLKDTNFGLICLTPENLSAEWMLFEAGALAKSLESARVVPILLDMRKSDLSYPLAQFQAIEANKEEFLELAHALNKALGSENIPTATLLSVFEAMWSKLQSNLENLEKSNHNQTIEVKRSDSDILAEVLESVRTIQREIKSSQSIDKYDYASGDWEDYLIRGVSLANQRSDSNTNVAALRSYSHAIAIAPSNVDKNMMSRLYAYRAALLKRLGRLEESENDLVLAKKWASDKREITDAMYNMACVLTMQQKLEPALTELEQLFDLDPSWVRIVQTKSYFENLFDAPEFTSLLKKYSH